MKILKIIALALIGFLLIQDAQGQRFSSLQFGTAIPINEFAELDSPDDIHAGASIGLNFGAERSYQLAKCGFGIFGSMDLHYNGLKKDYKKNSLRNYYAYPDEVRFDKYPSYMNFPVTIGLNYTLSNNHIGVSAKAGLSVNTLKMSNTELQVDGISYIQEMAVANSFGYKIGGELLIDQRVSVAVNYFSLGMHTIESHIQRKGYRRTNPVDEIQLKVSMMTVTVGFRTN